MELLHEAANLRVAAHANLTVTAWTDAPRAGQLPQISEISAARLRDWPSGLFSVNVVLAGTPNFSAEVREEATALAKRELTTLGIAHVIMFTGFKGVAVRGFISTMLLLARSKVQTRVHGNFAEAIPFVIESLGASQDYSWSQAELLRELGESTEGLARDMDVD